MRGQGQLRRRQWIPLGFGVWTIGLALAPLGGCGPSFQALYEGDARFEHCYALDEDPTASMPRKADCWHDWSMHYTYGQTRDRVEYASARYAALSRSELPTDEAMMGAAPGGGASKVQITAPAPTSAFAPPPKTMDAVGVTADASVGQQQALANGSAAAGSSSGIGSPPPPGANCSDDCRDAWHSCSKTCIAKDCSSCGKTFKRCMRECYVEKK